MKSGCEAILIIISIVIQNIGFMFQLANFIGRCRMTTVAIFQLKVLRVTMSEKKWKDQGYKLVIT